MNFTSVQKKVIGLFIAIFFIILESFLVLMMIASVLMYPEQASLNAFQFLFSIGIFSFPLFYGLRMYKAGKSELIQLSEPVDREKTLRMDVHLSFRDYRRLMMLLTYKHPAILFVTLIGLGMLLPPLFMPIEYQVFHLSE